MKESNLGFLEGMLSNKGVIAKAKGEKLKIFDWDKAAQIIRDKFKLHLDLVAEAGLQGDWDYTGGIILENGKPDLDNYTYLASLWAIPTLILNWNNSEQEELECYTIEETRFDESSKWDNESLKILNS